MRRGRRGAAGGRAERVFVVVLVIIVVLIVIHLGGHLAVAVPGFAGTITGRVFIFGRAEDAVGLPVARSRPCSSSTFSTRPAISRQAHQA